MWFFDDLGGLVAQTLAPATAPGPDAAVVDARLGPAATLFMDGLGTGLATRCIPSLVRGLDVVVGQLADRSPTARWPRRTSPGDPAPI